ncbi:histone-lysine N-methyltransferase SETMAR-like [Contarinia nasturtii]|uniref:histone-lysine N-methyltransferase SETMAR-like n=1 Tax=Contarinia nasturtii TaxID=265458 RepID=UPI0012D49BAC|nr:histone-lysine N-methyltransferase SETMAR-like [Contarinia nasturtii]
MIASFFSVTGHVATVCLEDQRSVNAEWYTTICLPKVIAEIRKSNFKRRIILHHDNAGSHTAKKTNDYLTAQSIDLLHHPPYSPDLAPCDFFLFPKVKDQMRGMRFSSPEEAVDAYKMHIFEMSNSDWHNCYEEWFHRMNKCIDVAGEYFEKQ